MKKAKLESDDEVGSDIDEIDDWCEYEQVKSISTPLHIVFDDIDGTSRPSTTLPTKLESFSLDEMESNANAKRTANANVKRKASAIDANTNAYRPSKSNAPRRAVTKNNAGHFKWTAATEAAYNRLVARKKTKKEIAGEFQMSINTMRRLHAKFVDRSVEIEWNDDIRAKLIQTWNQKQAEIITLLHDGLCKKLNDSQLSKRQMGKELLHLIKIGRVKIK